MPDHMLAFHQLLSIQADDMKKLIRTFPDFYRYAKILETSPPANRGKINICFAVPRGRWTC
jgi:hypothetical protein